MSTATATKAPEFTASEIKQRVRHALMDNDLWEWGWDVRVGSALKQLGSCNYGTKIITISLPLANLYGEDHLEDTILHEIAHALAGPQAGHGPAWKSVCRAIGANPDRLANVPPELAKQTYRWEVRCPHCVENRVGYKTSMSRRRGNYICSHCKNTRNENVRIEYRSIANPKNGWNGFHR